MAKYFCPYCPQQYQIHRKRSDGIMVCGQCGDELVKTPLIRPIQIIGIIAASAFLSPLLLMIGNVIQIESLKSPQSIESKF